MTVSTGIGGGLILNKQPYSGAHESRRRHMVLNLPRMISISVLVVGMAVWSLCPGLTWHVVRDAQRVNRDQ